MKKNIIICGTGFQTETLVKYYKQTNTEVLCVLVRCFSKKPEDCYLIPSKRLGKRNSFSESDMIMDAYIEGVPVKRFDMLNEIEKKAFFVFTNDEESMFLYDFIKSRGDFELCILGKNELDQINEIVWNKSSLVEELWITNKYLYSELELLKNCMRRQLKQTIYDFHIEFHLVEHCNLKCAGCTHFSSIAEENFLKVSEFENDINRLSKLTGGVIRFINLLGGEPLLHPQITSFLSIARKAFPHAEIRIVTNGIKIKDMNKEFWNSCRKNKIIIGVTEYPIGIDYSMCKEIIKNENVGFESFNGDYIPRDEMWRLSLDSAGSSKPLENFIKCPRANACIFISHGKVFNCATMANIEHFNRCFEQNFEVSEDDYIDIYSVSDISEVLQFLCNPKPFCRFCNIENRKYGVKWSKTTASIEEWT